MTPVQQISLIDSSSTAFALSFSAASVASTFSVLTAGNSLGIATPTFTLDTPNYSASAASCSRFAMPLHTRNISPLNVASASPTGGPRK